MTRPCPECGHALTWDVEHPPIPMTLYTWFDDEGRPVQFCPACDVELPTGDLRPVYDDATMFRYVPLHERDAA